MRADLKQSLRRVALFVSALGMVGCGAQKRSAAELKVTNGRELTAAEKEKFKPVVKLDLNGGMGLCTGTFISQEVVLTAGHCLKGKMPASVSGIDSIEGYTAFGSDENPFTDFAILIFPKGTAAKLGIAEVAKVSDAPVAEGDDVTLVGYGVKSMIRSTGVGVARIGFNKVEKSMGGLIALVSKASGHGTGDQAGLGSGDSGGALFNSKGEIVGTASLVMLKNEQNKWKKWLMEKLDYTSNNSRSLFIDIHGDLPKEFFQHVSEDTSGSIDFSY